MKSQTKNTYLLLLLIHVIIGLVVFMIPFLAKIYSLLIMVFGYGLIIKNKNANNEVLFVSAYIVGAEVLLRMTEGALSHEYAKYNIIVLMVLGMLYRGIYKGSYIYFIYLLLLIPGVFYGVYELSFDANIRKAIAFNISGPVCLGIAAIYCFGRAVSLKQMKQMFVAFGMPILSMVVYLILYSNSINAVVLNTGSNHDMSGGFGPNQVSTILGFGIFVFFVLFYLFTKTKREKIFTVLILIIISFRGIMTFSRGGIYTGIGMVVFFIGSTYFVINSKARVKVIFMLLVGLLLSAGIWTYSSLTTGGLIDKRYANQDAVGRVKKSRLTGRETLIESELMMFWENPITGVGVGKNKEIREELTGIEIPTHNEISRMLAEHGMLGLISFLLILFTPLFYHASNRQNIFAIPFFVFWILTINHAAMRLAAPGFIYALALLKLKIVDEEPTLRRE